jgi:hypothetical protein
VVHHLGRHTVLRREFQALGVRTVADHRRHAGAVALVPVLALRGTSTACGDIWAVVYGLRSSAQAVNVIAGTQTGEQTNSPAEGTA